MKHLLLFSAAIVILLAVAGVYAGLDRFAGSPAAPANFVQNRIVLPKMTLIDHEARQHELTGELTEGALVVINFNYTTCDSICPIGNDVMARLHSQVDQVDGRPVRLLSITIDPARDTVARLNAAARQFEAGDNWLWLTGDPPDIESLLQRLDADIADIELHDPVFLVGDVASGRFYRSLSMPDAEELLAMLHAIAV